MTVPALLDLCIQAAACSNHWTVQRRSLERLPDHAANDLLALLLLRQAGGPSPQQPQHHHKQHLKQQHLKQQQQLPMTLAPTLRPATLELFRHAVTRVALSGSLPTNEWMAVLAGFSHLQELQLLGCSRLTDSSLQLLLGTQPKPQWSSQPSGPAGSPAAAALRRLDLSGCRRVGDAGLRSVARARGLTALNITETGIQGGPGLSALTELTQLTCLKAGGLKEAGDTHWTAALHPLTRLHHLELWGSTAGAGSCGAGGGGARSDGEELLLMLACLPALRHLSLAWTHVSTLPALPGLEVLDMSHCQLRDVWWPMGHPDTPLKLQQLMLRGATVAGLAASSLTIGLAGVLRHAAASLELLDLREARSPDPWVVPLAALGPALGDESGGAGGGCAPRLTQLHLSQSSLRPEDLEHLQAAPALQRLAAAGTSVGSPVGAAALWAAGLQQLQDLNLKQAGVTDESLPWLAHLTALTQLVLAGNPQLTLAPPPPPPPLPPPPLPRLPPPGAAQPPAHQPAAAQPNQQQQQPPLQVVDPRDPGYDVWAPEPQPQRWPGRGRGELPPAAAAAAAEGVPEAGRGGRAAPAAAWPKEWGRAGGGCLWPRLRRIDLLGTAVGEAGLWVLLAGGGGAETDREEGGSSSAGGPGEEAGEGGRSGRQGPTGSLCLEQLKIGGPAFTDATVAVLAAAQLPRLHSLLVRDAPLSGHGALRLAACSASLRRLELQGCWLVSDQDAAALASAATAASAAPVAVLVNGKAAFATGTATSAGAAGMAATTTAGAGPGAGSAKPRVKSAAGTKTPGGIAGRAEDLAPYDQRLRYSREELLQLAESPWVSPPSPPTPEQQPPAHWLGQGANLLGSRDVGRQREDLEEAGASQGGPKAGQYGVSDAGNAAVAALLASLPKMIRRS